VIINSFWHMFQPLDTRTVEDLFFAILGIIIISNYLKDVRGCYPYIFTAVGINLFIMVLQKFGYNIAIGWTPGTHGAVGAYVGGLMGNSSRLAMYITLVLPFIWSVSITLFMALVGAILLCGEHNVLFVLGVFLIFKYHGWRRIVSTIATIGVFFLYRQHYITSLVFRWENVWKETIDLIFKQPLLGYGFGNWYLIYGRESYNSYLPFIFGLGILGLAWLVYTIGKFRKDLIKSTEGLAVLTLLILCSYEYVIEVPRLWFTIIFIIAAFLIKKGGNNESDLSGPIACISSGV